MPDHIAWEDVATSVGVVETARAEEITLEQWIEITRMYDDHPLKDIPQKDDEIFDVVDDNDEVIRQEKRAVVHADGLKHRAVHVFVFNKKKEVFLQKRSRLKDVYPGKWDSSAAGHLDTGEDYACCVVRELHEELGIQTEHDDVQEIAKLKPSELNGQEFIGLYLARHDGAVRFPCSEVESGMWIGIEDLTTWVEMRPDDFASGFLVCWETFCKKMNS